MKRVFITGVGIVSPLGNDRESFLAALKAGKSGISRLERLDTTDLPILIGGEVRGLDTSLAEAKPKVVARKMDNASIYGVVAAREALTHAGLPTEDLGPRCGVILGSGLAGLETLQLQTENLLNTGPRAVSPFTIPVLMPNAAAANISLATSAMGTAYSVSSACASSGHAMIDAFEELQRGDLDVIITGGTEAAMTRLAISAFANMKAMTKKFNDDPEHASRPFDRDRDGFIMSEGACLLIFETEEHARQRGVTPLAEVIGYGATMDCHHLVQPDVEGKGATRAVERALRMAEMDPAKVAANTYVNAHGTSTHFNDLMETVTLKHVFGDAAKRLQISSTKSMTGHMIGAACAIETAACVMALTQSVLPPTINYDTPDPECDLDYVPNEAREAKVDYALNNSFGFGGHNVCLAFRRVS